MSQHIVLDDVAVIGIGARRLSKEELTLFCMQELQYQPENTVLEGPLAYYSKNTFLIDDVLVKLSPFKLKAKRDVTYLEEFKKTVDQTVVGVPGYYSRIEKFDNIDVLMTDIPQLPGNDRVIFFYSVNKLGNRNINGTVFYHKADSVKAFKTFYKLLQSVKFKN